MLVCKIGDGARRPVVPCHSYNRGVLPAAVILDFDGVILDSETPEFESHRRGFEQCGATLTNEEWCVQLGPWSEGLGGRWRPTLISKHRSGSASIRRGRLRSRTPRPASPQLAPPA